MPKPRRQDDQALLLAARASPQALAEFYERFEEPLLCFFQNATRRPELAADLTAETFARVIEVIVKYDAARERLGFPRLMLDDHALEVIARVGSDAATSALAELPAEQREAIQARAVEGRDYAEIAGDLQCSEAVVRQRVSRGLRALRTRLVGDR